MKLILNIKNPENCLLAARAGKFLMENDDRHDALLEYGDNPRHGLFYVIRNKASISVWEQ